MKKKKRKEKKSEKCKYVLTNYITGKRSKGKRSEKATKK